MSQEKSLVARFADRYGVDQSKLLQTLKSTAFKQKEGVEISNEQMMALLVVADQYKLNPFTKEIYAYPDKNGIVPIVGIDGWNRIANDHPKYDGIEFVYAEKIIKMEGSLVECPEWIECVIYRTDRSRPTRAREYLDECYKKPFKAKAKASGSRGDYTVIGPWQTHTKRMLRTKAHIQCSRMTFGFGGIYDQDEAENIRDVKVINPQDGQHTPRIIEEVADINIEDDPELSALLPKLIERGKKSNAWKTCIDYVDQRYGRFPEKAKALKQALLDAQLGINDVDSASNSHASEDKQLTHKSVPESELVN